MEKQQMSCVFCEADIAPTELDPVTLEIVTRDEEWQAFYYAHARCLQESGPRMIREYANTWKT